MNKIINVSKNKRIVIKKKWALYYWKYCVYPESKLLWFFWGTSGWGSGNLRVRIHCYYSLDEAIRKAKYLKNNYLKG